MKKLLFMCGVFYFYLQLGSNDGSKEDSAKTKSNANKQNLRSLKEQKKRK